MSELLNLFGLAAGVALYAMLLMMVVRRAPATGSSVDPLLLVTALLGLAWNLCALSTYELPKLGIESPLRLLNSVGLSALGFLPAVVVHSVLRGDRARTRHRVAVSFLTIAYGVSAAAALLNLQSIWTSGPMPSAVAMRLLTFAFMALLVPLFAFTRGQAGSRRALWVSALSIFAVSALHLSQTEQGDGWWVVELVGHHASLPLAIAILYQDFPFALADLFLKRALTLLALVAAPFLTLASLGVRSATGVRPLGDARDIAILVTLWIATALFYPKLRNFVGWFVDAVVLKRPDYGALRAHIGRNAQRHDDVPSMLDDVCRQLVPALNARVVRWRDAGDGDSASPASGRRSSTGAALVEIPVAEPPRYVLEVAQLTGGRRLLSDDHAFLEAIASLLGRRIDAIRITRERYERELREQEIGKLATEAELRALRSQINPHFLFNALTTIGYLIQTAPARALETLLRMTALLRGVLRSEGEMTTLGRELDLIESYLEIERARFEDRLDVRIEVAPKLRDIQVPPFLLQPVVENAIKHGIGPTRDGGEVVVTARIDSTGDGSRTLVLVVRDSGAGATPAELRRGRQDGVGLSNVERRLAGQYGAAAGLTIQSRAGLGTTVQIHLPAERASGAEATGKRTA